jgi:phosphoenolpyruvate carboxylase
MPRKIHSTIASQHPDHAKAPYWQPNDAFISSSAEIQETMIAFQDLGIEEYKWDWEGKLVDESVIERLFANYYEYFQKHQLGAEKYLTFRLPNPFEETEFRVGRAFMCILTAAALAQKAGLHHPPLFEVIQPMAESAKAMIDIQEAFRELAGLKHWMFNMQKAKLDHIEVIPLFEQIDVIIKSDEILAQYLKMHEEKFGFTPKYMRPYVARSDPAMNSGHIATVIALKFALANYARLEAKTGVKMYPMVGCAALPFRGGLTPLNVDDFVNEYRGFKTILIQSAFRYDYSQEEALAGINRLKELLPVTEARDIPLEDETDLYTVAKIFEKHYQSTIEFVAPLVNQIAAEFPRRRERVQHTGLFGYSRGVGSVTLPRAIKTTGSLYSVGMPPELFGTGRGIKEITKKGLLPLFQKYYINFAKDYKRVAGFVNKENVTRLAQDDKRFNLIMEDIVEIEKYLGIEFGPTTKDQNRHYEITTEILTKSQAGEPIGELITQSGVLRKSIG